MFFYSFMQQSINYTSSQKRDNKPELRKEQRKGNMLSPYTNLGSRGFVRSAKAKHVKEMICSVSLEEDFFF